jgi:hypothetical protein
VRRCFARLGSEVRFYTSAVAMDDLEAVRRALGYDGSTSTARPTVPPLRSCICASTRTRCER